MLNLVLAGLVVYLVALTVISGAAIRLCRRLGMDPREVLVWFGLAEMPKAHPFHRDRSRSVVA